MQEVERKAVEKSGDFIALRERMVYTGKKSSPEALCMKLKSTKLFLCGILTALLLIRNLQDSQFVMSFFFAVVAWQCLRAAFEAKGFDSDEERKTAFQAASRKFYGPLAGIAWALPYAALIVCAAVGALMPAMQMPAVWVFIMVVAVHSACEVVVWKKAVKEK